MLTHTATADPVSDARRQVDEARQAADAAAARFSQAQTAYDQLGDQITALQQQIAIAQAKAAKLRGIARARAVASYQEQGSGLGVVLDTDDPLAVERSAVLLDRVNQVDNATVSAFVSAEKDLAQDRDQLGEQRKRQKDALDQLQAERSQLDAKLAAAQQAEQQLEQKAQQDAIAAAALAKRAASASPPAASAPPTAGVNAPVIDGMVCPVPGAAFSDDFGQPRSGGRSHEGVDMFAPIGASDLAVVSGSVTYGDAGLGGMGAWIAGDNGVTYAYFHLSAYVGGPRHVTQGELIGRVGQTGDATAPHTHFEIHPGGGAAIDPFPTLSRIC